MSWQHFLGYVAQASFWRTLSRPTAPDGMSIHEGHIRDVGRLVRVESGDLRCHPLAAVELESGSASGRDSVTR
jgi:hypothetical protein